MAEKIVEKQFCGKCGVDVRPNTLFCYNCGSQVASDEEVELENSKAPEVSNAWFKEEIADSKKFETSKLDSKLVSAQAKEKVKSPAIPKPTDSITSEELPKTEKSKTSQLKTASSLRKQKKLNKPKQTWVTWESYENAPNLWFLLVALVLTLFAVGILFAMLYIR